MNKIPKQLRQNASFTKVSWQDPHILPKLFARQFPYGTGGYQSALETIDDFKHYMLHTIHSLDGEFLDDKDGGEFLFFTYELSLKRKLYRDYVGRAMHAENRSLVPATKQELYSDQRYSHRLAEIIPNSKEALQRWKTTVQHLCLPGNRGPPTAMTTIVSNAHASTIWAHVERGALSQPNAEDTLRYFNAEPSNRNINEHVALQTLDYRRRRRDFLGVAYATSQDAIRGKIPDRIARDEDQQRGHRHAHINEFAERCGPSHDSYMTSIPMVADNEGALSKTTSVQHRGSCRSVSQWCIKCGKHCSLPPHMSASEKSAASVYHTNAHTAESTAEMLRPYPLGTVPPQSPEVPDVVGQSLEETLALLNKDFWTADRLESKARSDLSCEGSFLQRFMQQRHNKTTKDAAEIALGDPTGMRDLCVAFYYRYLQTKVVPHVCKLGYCRASWDHACKYDLPCEEVVETMYFDEDTRRTKPRRTHLDDDAYNKTTTVECIVASLMNVQVNAHHPEGDAPNACYPIKYGLKPERSLKLQIGHESDDAVLRHFRGQFISLGEVVQAHLGDSVVDATFSQEIAPLMFPSWQVQYSMKQVQTNWRNYTYRYPYKNITEHLNGYNCEVHAHALQLSILMATSARFLRYFNSEIVRKDQKYPLHPASMTRYIWKETVEDIHQTNYDPILAEVLPSYRLYLESQNAENTSLVVHRKLSKDELRYPRFFFYTPVQKPGKDDMMLRTHHFRIRLFEHLPWLAVQNNNNGVTDGDYIFSLLPRVSFIIPHRIKELVEVVPLSTQIAAAGEKWKDLQTLRVNRTCIDHAPGQRLFLKISAIVLRYPQSFLHPHVHKNKRSLCPTFLKLPCHAFLIFSLKTVSLA